MAAVAGVVAAAARVLVVAPRGLVERCYVFARSWMWGWNDWGALLALQGCQKEMRNLGDTAVWWKRGRGVEEWSSGRAYMRSQDTAGRRPCEKWTSRELS